VRAHLFDIDGTLLHGTTAPLLMANVLGRQSSSLRLPRRNDDHDR
jgi:hypothetical protein